MLAVSVSPITDAEAQQGDRRLLADTLLSAGFNSHRMNWDPKIVLPGVIILISKPNDEGSSLCLIIIVV